MATQNEQEIIAEFIQLYKAMPCLWNSSCEAYKDKILKQKSWEILTCKIQELEPDGNEASAKRKVEHLKSSYFRELRKVKESKKNVKSGTASEIHVPKLWYYDLMSFLRNHNKRARRNREESESSVEEEEEEEEVIMTIVEEEPDQTTPRKKRHSQQEIYTLKRPKKLTAIENEELQAFRKQESTTFGTYVGQKLSLIPSEQREIAEKLISDVLFLAKTNNLNFTSKIVTSTKHDSPYFAEITPTIHVQSRSPSQSPNYIHDSPSANPLSPEPYIDEESTPKASPVKSKHSGSGSMQIESPTGDILKELLTEKRNR